MRKLGALLIVGAVALSGCGTIEKQAFNKGANSAIRTITILEPAPSQGFGVQVMNHPALGSIRPRWPPSPIPSTR